MTNFETVRIPATRTGSGIRRVVLPSKTERIGGPRVGSPGEEQDFGPLARVRRHIAKGFSDQWPDTEPSESPGSTIVHEINNWQTENPQTFFNTIKVNCTMLALTTVYPLDPPNVLGQMLLIYAYDEFPAGVGQAIDYSCSQSPSGTHIILGSTDYDTVTLTRTGDNVLFVGVDDGMYGLCWAVLGYNGVSFV